MEFNKKYVGDSEKGKEENQNKIILTDDAFALCESIQELINEIRREK